jgi:hypothetical protein
MPAWGTMARVLLCVVWFAAASGGCTTECHGPECEASYAGGKLSILGGRASAEPLDAWDDAEGLYEGNEDDGTDFVVSFAEDTVLLGQPDAGRVIPLVPIDGAAPIPTDPPAFFSPGMRFGASVLAQPTAEGFDLWVGAPEDRFAKGTVYLFRSAHTGVRPADDADLALVSESPAGRYGTRLFACADLDGDTLRDVAVSAPWYNPLDAPIPALAGGVFLVLTGSLPAPAEGAEGIPTVLASAGGRTWWGSGEGEAAGDSVLCDEDVDGDGSVDLVIGAPFAGAASETGAGGTQGRVYVLDTGDLLPEGDLPLDEVARVVLDGDGEEWFGTSLATLVLDGTPVLVVGAAGFDGGQGRVWLLPGGQPTPDAVTITFPPVPGVDREDRETVHLGRYVGAADTDGDGVSDLVVGAPDLSTSATFTDVGRLWVFLASGSDAWAPGMTTDDADLAIEGTEPFERVGQDVGLADIDGDGDTDLLLPTRASLE